MYDAIKMASARVNKSIDVGSYYRRGVDRCGGVACVVSSDLAKLRDRVMRYPQAFHDVVQDGADMYLDTLATGCPNRRLLDGWIRVVDRWASGGGFTGQHTTQGEVEVDWKLSAIASGYLKMRAHIPESLSRKVVAWVQVLYTQSVTRTVRRWNNHYIWNRAALVWASIVLNKPDQIALHTNDILYHMNEQIVESGVVKTEGRCILAPKYHAYYMQACLGGLAGYKIYFGQLPPGKVGVASWASIIPRARKTINIINTRRDGARIIEQFKAFLYEGTPCRASQMTLLAADEVDNVNALFAYMTSTANGPASCTADTAYWGKLNYIPLMFTGAPRLNMTVQCCRKR